MSNTVKVEQVETLYLALLLWIRVRTSGRCLPLLFCSLICCDVLMSDVLSTLMMIKSPDVDQSVILSSELDFLYTCPDQISE